MKSCPTCNRTFEDTFTFCLIDGSILSAPFDPSERRAASIRSNEAAPTEVISAPAPPGETRAPLQSTIRAPAPQVPLWKSDEPAVYDLSHKKSNAPRLIRWAFVVRGLTGILIGILTFVSSQPEFFSFLFHDNEFALFAAYALVGSGCAVLAGWRMWSEQKIGWLLLLDAVVGVLWGLLLLSQPPDWLLPLSVGLAAWPIATGVLQAGAAFQLRKFLMTAWLLTLAGIISFLYGLALLVTIALLSRPYLTVGKFVWIVWMIAAYEIISGLLLTIFGFSVRARHEKNIQSA